MAILFIYISHSCGNIICGNITFGYIICGYITSKFYRMKHYPLEQLPQSNYIYLSIYLSILIYQPLRSGRICHKVSFYAEFNSFEFRVFLLID